MTRMVKCKKYNKELPGLLVPPYPGSKGQGIYETVSQKAWQEWQSLQTMLINEYRLTPFEPKARQFLEKEMEKFFFGEGSEKPEGFLSED